MNFAHYLLLSLTLIAGTSSANTVIDELNSLALNNKAPIVHRQQVLADGVQSFYFEGSPYKGKATRIFAYYNKPAGDGPFPAIVLVHGGGGSAYKQWVKKWNDAGFAAISIAVEGQTGTQINKRPPNKWEKHQWSGPKRAGIYEDADNPLFDQWMYHASSAVINAHNLLRSFEEIKKDQIGLSGISWGGVITSTVIGFDQRFAFAIPIYGSGFLNDLENHYGEALKDNRTYQTVWEPALRIANFKNPTFWLTGLKENNFSLDAQAKTYKLLHGQHVQSIQPKLKHNHPAGWAPKEQYEFAKAVINGDLLPNFSQHKLVNNVVSVTTNMHQGNATQANRITSAVLFYSNDVGHTFNRVWQQLPVTIESRGERTLLISKLPASATAWIFNIEHNNLLFSSELYERKQ